jgi:hypothetical protein
MNFGAESARSLVSLAEMIRLPDERHKRLLAPRRVAQHPHMPRDFLQPSADDPLVLYPFRFHDPVLHRWVKARYVAEYHEIAARYAEWEIVGPPEVRTRTGGAYSPRWRG